MSERDRAKARRNLRRQIAAGAPALDQGVALLKSLDPASWPLHMLPRLLEVGSTISPRRTPAFDS
jgi:hypothetical protein